MTSYLSGSTQDRANGLAIDSDGNAYVTGFATSLDFPGINRPQPFPGAARGTYFFVGKLDAKGSSLLYMYAPVWGADLGSPGLAPANGIAIDSKGQAYQSGHKYADRPELEGRILSVRRQKEHADGPGGLL